MQSLLGLTLEELEEVLAEYGEKKFRAQQIFAWLFKGARYKDMRNIPKSLIEKLKKDYIEGHIENIKKLESADGTSKYLFLLNDSNIIESVLLSYKHGNTLCISTQVGCRMGCEFCASGKDGLIRNLTAAEMLSQVIEVNRQFKDRGVTNIVLMGSGEPLDNYDNTLLFLKLINHEKGLNVSLRNVSVSTCGLIPQMVKLADEGLGITLCISLHAADDETRKQLMPTANAYTIKEIINAAKYYFSKTKRRVIIEYALIDNVNCETTDANRLSMLLRGLSAHVNLIPLNEGGGKQKAPNNKKVRDFLETLEKNNISATIRRALGSDIDGACGQLRAKHLEEAKEHKIPEE